MGAVLGNVLRKERRSVRGGAKDKDKDKDNDKDKEKGI